MNDQFEFTPLVIVGAARSGTNALRDALTMLSGFSTWPCDEINPIWRHGNLDWPNDEIPSERATEHVSRSIRRSFQEIWLLNGRTRFVVEKTCANSLRVPFVNRVLPEARYIFIVRNGYDVIASARKRWKGELEVNGLRYYLAKARFAPKLDLPRYAFSAVCNRIAMRFGRQRHFSSWGPQFSGLEELQDVSLEEIVARQWAACVTSSDKAFSRIGKDKVLVLKYERFASCPAVELTKILEWLNFPVSPLEISAAASTVRHTSIGKGEAIASSFPEDLGHILEQPMLTHGYLNEGTY